LLVAAGCLAVARTDMAHHYANKSQRLLVFTMTVAELYRGWVNPPPGSAPPR